MLNNIKPQIPELLEIPNGVNTENYTWAPHSKISGNHTKKTKDNCQQLLTANVLMKRTEFRKQ